MTEDLRARIPGSASPSDDAPSKEEAALPVVVDVSSGGSLDLRVRPVTKRIGDATVRMLAYGGSIPGPTIRVRQGARITVQVRNDTDLPTTVHWHGLRLENPYDGVPHQTQAPIPPGGTYTHELVFPDPGLYWYHPHIREDYAQELGLYGNVVVEPADPTYWPPADREVVLTLDDLLLEDGDVAPYDPGGANYTAMGRFGNVLLVGGQTDARLRVRQGEVLRLLLTNTANTRVFKVAAPGARMKLVGGDAGRVEREAWVDDVVIAPSERAVIDVCYHEAGDFALQHLTPRGASVLAAVRVEPSPATTPAAAVFADLRVNADMVAERERVVPFRDAPPDKVLALVAEMDVTDPEPTAPASYACPMHPDVVRDAPGHCPRCGMKLLPAAQIAAAAGDVAPHAHGHGHDHADAMADGIEWEDLMPEVNRTTTTANMHWKLVDRETGAVNDAIDWTFVAGDQVKVRLVNEMTSDHPMHHPFHVHGERFLVLARDGVPEPNLVWKDTVLLRTGETVDVLLDASNPGRWMAHCHIPEHMETGMMFTFRVVGDAGAPLPAETTG